MLERGSYLFLPRSYLDRYARRYAGRYARTHIVHLLAGCQLGFSLICKPVKFYILGTTGNGWPACKKRFNAGIDKDGRPCIMATNC